MMKAISITFGTSEVVALVKLKEKIKALLYFNSAEVI